MLLSRPLPLLAAASLLLAPALPARAADGLPAISNPQISLILDGVAYADDLDGNGDALLGEAAGIAHAHGSDAHDHGHGGLEQGFNLRGAEVVLSATVDQAFDGYATLAFDADGVELEEAWFATRALPGGWQIKGGKFFSGFGYLNAKHPHGWDFVDQNLAYRSLLGEHGLNDTGLQASWLAPTDAFLQFGIEALQGDAQEKFGSAVDAEALAAALADADAAGTLAPDPFALPGDLPAADNLPVGERRGAQIVTGFVKFAPELGAAHALQLGASFARHRGQQEMHLETDPADNVTAVFHAEGEATLLGLEAVYKRSATGRNGKGALRASAEYLRLEKDLDIVYHTDATAIGAPLTARQDAFYLQGVYGFAPRWEAGLRHDATGIDASIREDGNRETLDASARTSLVLAFRPGESSTLRLQVGRARIVDAHGDEEKFTQVMLQYNLGLGAHGAHAF